ncbi:MAG: nickel-dependent hydrogenase large subunit [Planctomycetes bacterium]|nr:nickel-dependent hydrogenase large subunit [Planctomycetota bacterium]
MGRGAKIEIDYLARVEGETALTVELDGAPLLQLKIFEPPRFFEGFLVGRKYNEVGDIVSRICGICPISHMTTAILAVEKATGIQVSEQTTVLRHLLAVSQIVASHLVHLYTLAMPDYYGYPGITGMLERFPDEMARFIRMKNVMNHLSGLIGGRPLHPVTHLPGGFTSIPHPDEFGGVLEELRSIRADAEQAVRDVVDFQLPEFFAPCENVALNTENRYSFNEGRIVSDRGLDISVDDYDAHFKEWEVPYAFAKQSAIAGRNIFRVGALARLSNKFDELADRTKSLAHEVCAGLREPNHNPFNNNLAQSLEIVEGIEQCIGILESRVFEEEEIDASPEPGAGGAATEAPRGLLYHWYRINRKGVVEQAKIVTPTAHNFLVIERDLKELVSERRDLDRGKLRLLCEQLVRAYDPCFSCSVH